MGILSLNEALKKSHELGVDLVEVASKANPPVCRLIDFKKFRYLEAKKERLEKRKSKEVELKEIRLGPFTEKHDITVRINRAKEFLKKNNRVRITIKFTGREIAKKEFGFLTINKILESLKEVSKIEKEPHFEGRLLVALISPIKKAGEIKNAKSKK